MNQASAYTIAGVVPERLGNAHPSISPYELYPTGDGDLVVAVGNPARPIRKRAEGASPGGGAE